MGGVGKTSVARAYANRHLDDYGIVLWIRAEDPAAVDAEFRGLLEVLLPAGEAARIGDARIAAMNLLAQQPDPWLLVLDNVQDAAAAHGLLPPAGDGHVLITSRDPRWPNVTTVEPLDTDAAVELLDTSDADGARVLADELGGLPLALSQAAGFMRANGISVATYLRLYRDRGAELHAEGRPADYPHTVATTWQLAMDRLTDQARELLNLIARYAPDAIPVHLLLSSWDELTRHRAIGELIAYGLVSPATDDTITVHRLVQAVTRHHSPSDEWPERAHELAVAAGTELPPAANWLAVGKALHTHLVALLDHLPQEHPAALTTRLALADWTGESGNAGLARQLCAELVLIRERVSGPADPDTLATKRRLAYWTGSAGFGTDALMQHAAQARDQYAELLPALERVRGAEHTDTLRTRLDLAHWTGVAGDPPRARELVAEVLPMLDRVWGAEHRDTLHARQQFAHWTARSGDLDGARVLFDELIQQQERAFGAEHPTTLNTRGTVATWLAVSGDMESARDMYDDLLPVLKRVLGVEHPGTVRTWEKLASWTGWAGDSARARDLFIELMPYLERTLGAEHRETLRTRRELAYWTRQAGDATRARDLLADLLPIQERVLGADDRDTVSTRDDLKFVNDWGAPSQETPERKATIPEPPKLPGVDWFNPPTNREKLGRLDEDLASGRISAEDYRARREQLIKAIMDDDGTPPGHTHN